MTSALAVDAWMQHPTPGFLTPGLQITDALDRPGAADRRDPDRGDRGRDG